jgi:uncharacterized protein (DUF342 family)
MINKNINSLILDADELINERGGVIGGVIELLGELLKYDNDFKDYPISSVIATGGLLIAGLTALKHYYTSLHHYKLELKQLQEKLNKEVDQSKKESIQTKIDQIKLKIQVKEQKIKEAKIKLEKEKEKNKERRQDIKSIKNRIQRN